MQQGMNMTAKAPVPAQNSEGGAKLAVIIAIVLAIIGVGFGAWAVISNSSQKNELIAKIGDLEEENAELQEKADTGSGGGGEECKPEIKVIKYQFAGDNVADLGETDSATISSISTTGIRFTLKADGTSEAEYKWVNWESYDEKITKQKRNKDVLNNYVTGKIVDFATGHIGSGEFGVSFFLFEDGTVSYIQDEDLLAKNLAIKKLEGAEDVVRVYGNIMNSEIAGYIQKSDGKFSPIVLDKNESGSITLKLK